MNHINYLWIFYKNFKTILCRLANLNGTKIKYYNFMAKVCEAEIKFQSICII